MTSSSLTLAQEFPGSGPFKWPLPLISFFQEGGDHVQFDSPRSKWIHRMNQRQNSSPKSKRVLCCHHEKSRSGQTRRTPVPICPPLPQPAGRTRYFVTQQKQTALCTDHH